MEKDVPKNNYIALLPLLRCPICKGKIVKKSAANLECADCTYLFEVIDNVPRFYDKETADLDQKSISSQKREQLEFHQQTDYTREMTSSELSQFMITRPYGHSRFFTKMWEYPLVILTKELQKLFPAIALFNEGSVLDIGCGGGLEAYFLASRGAKVVGVDIASLRCEASIKRFSNAGLDGVFIQADATNLPFCDLAFDMVITHDSLHHLPEAQLKKAIGEFCRVSKRILCFVEANDSILTRVLVMLGLTATVELSGNKVIRFSKSSINDLLSGTGYELVVYTPFFNKKTHFPKPVYKKPMSFFPFFHFYWGILSLANFFSCNFGNEMVAIATKEKRNP
jgi:SAM-dependent methyltransferase